MSNASEIYNKLCNLDRLLYFVGGKEYVLSGRQLQEHQMNITIKNIARKIVQPYNYIEQAFEKEQMTEADRKIVVVQYKELKNFCEMINTTPEQTKTVINGLTSQELDELEIQVDRYQTIRTELYRDYNE